jgi:soluble lytic murein transglycosylase-like protein
MKIKVAVLAIAVTVGSANANVKEMVRREARAQGVPEHLALGVARTESNFRCSAVGRAGERGVMQIKPRTARGVGFRGPAHALNNCAVGIRYGMKYLALAYRKARGNAHLAATYYNRGLGTKSRSSGYAKKVLGGR